MKTEKKKRKRDPRKKGNIKRKEYMNTLIPPKKTKGKKKIIK